MHRHAESGGETPWNNLWVGNLGTDVSDSDLMDVFARYGALDSVTTYAPRNFAFVYFKHVDDAKAAKQNLQGTLVRGLPIKIEFAKPAKPCTNLWVGGIGPSVTKEKLEEEFLKYGKLEEFKFLRDRNTAFADYFRLEDAIHAQKGMNGRRICGEQIRVDFTRSQPTRRPGNPLGGQKIDGQPSRVLWVGYPPSVKIEEQMLHNAMILFGEIERIRSFPHRYYSFVEFRSVDEARRAKEGLQGRLFNDPRITIVFSNSDLAPGNDDYGPNWRGPPEDTFFNDFPPFGPDMYNHNLPLVPHNFPGLLHPVGLIGPNMMMRPLGPLGHFEPRHPPHEFNDHPMAHNFPDLGPKNWRGPSSGPPMMLPSPPAKGPRLHNRPNSSPWDVIDQNQFQREPKRSRVDTLFSNDNAPFPVRNGSVQGVEIDRAHRPDRAHGPEGVFPGPLARYPANNLTSSVEAMTTTAGPGQSYSDGRHIWRGVIAKGGTPVCHARCVPIGKGISSELPEIVNCSARTGLDMLEKHYADAIGFDIIFFLPDSEDDFASYTEFLRYLGSKDRAGVAKFDDGTTLFLVPPSDFLTEVLNVTGPERLYGVVLKLPPQVPSSAPQQQQTQYLGKQLLPPLRSDHGLVSNEEQTLQMDYNRGFHGESGRYPKPPFPPTEETHAVPSAPQPNPSVSQPNPSVDAAPGLHSGVTLTPELIATLASLLPKNAANTQTPASSLGISQPSLGFSSGRPFPASSVPDRGFPSHGWKQDYPAPEQMGQTPQQLGHQALEQMGRAPQQLGHQALEQMARPPQQLGHQALEQISRPPQYLDHQTPEQISRPPQQMGHQSHEQMGHPPLPFTNQFNSQTQIHPNYVIPSQNYATISTPSSHSVQTTHVSSQIQAPASNYSNPAQTGPYSAAPQVNQPYQLEGSHSSQKGYVPPVHGLDPSRSSSSFGSQAFHQQPQHPITLSNQAPHGPTLSQPQVSMTLPSENVNLELPNQVQQPPSAPSAADHGTSVAEIDKNERYQQTLQFAASLLLQIQQQQQQTSSLAGQGSGN